MKHDERKFYVYVTKGNVTVLRFTKNAGEAMEYGDAMREWAGHQDVKVRAA